ncbi:phage tail protein [Pseudomonas sp. URMO17WK12:I11]|uniref:phage tail protein n=1 Tax=Pseudomonas sp. URMO17WK12:I11 TaxID=1283291 RepID=UPI000721B752|nr:phage tail protein [Pseudomonas sp. URMO17WK12:I11]CRL47759.1 Phage Tail Collar Domain protein [Pseudomonas sp. URMO17WK12:I11]
MIDANSQFFAILTNVGLAKQANADALGIPWKITEMGVGDANLTDPIPNAGQTRLINEWRRRPLNQLKVDAQDPSIIIAEQIIPADEGGHWIREIGLYDADGDLVAVANCAPSYKPLMSQGSGRTQVVRMNFIVNNSGNVTLKIDPAVVLASRSYVDAAILEVLPKNRTSGEWTRVKTNDRGLVVSGDNPNTLAGMGITDAYTKPQIEAMIAQASALPVGTMVAFPVNKIAPGFLEIDGSVKSIAALPDLATFLGGAFNLGNEGAGNFRLPESRAEFLRGWDHGRGVDAGRAVGSFQADDFKSHSHSYGIAAVVASGSGSGVISGGITPAASTTSVGGTETRPRNLAVMWCIKAWNAPINQGNIDIAALTTLAAQATEANQGTAKVASQAEVEAGVDDSKFVTAKKLLFGLGLSLLFTGFIRLPKIFGGFTLQWGASAVNASGDCVVTLPATYNTAHLQIFAISGQNTHKAYGYSAATLGGATIPCYLTTNGSKSTGGFNCIWFSIGK